MGKRSKRSPSFTCATNIALLNFLHVVPVQPSSKDVLQTPPDQHHRTLSLRHERDLTSALAVLSAVNEDVNRVSAVAVREIPSRQGLEVLVAVNKEGHHAGAGFLGKIKHGFDRILALLSRFTNEPDPDLEADVFRAIVAMCEQRIRSRLRFNKRKHNKKLRPLVAGIRSITSIVQSNEARFRNKGLWEDAQAFLLASRPLIGALDRAAKHQVQEQLLRAVDETYKWSRAGDWEEVLRVIPRKELDPVEFSDLSRTLRKIAQYQTASKRLCRVARECPMGRRGKVKLVNLSPAAFTRERNEDQQTGLLETLNRVSPEYLSAENLENMCGYLGTTPEKAKQDFLNMVQRIQNDSKIHAEIQILAYLRISTIGTPPRIVQSNKKACYLCNEALRLSGGLAISKSHGRLYTGWRLPNIPQLEKTQSELNHSLEEQARKSIMLLSRKRTKIGYKASHESSALTFDVDSTRVSLTDVAILQGSETGVVEPASDGITGPVVEGVAKLETLQIADNDESSTSESSPLDDSEDDNKGAINMQGSQVYSRRLQPDSPPSVFWIGPHSVCVEYSAESLPGQRRKRLTYDARLLDTAQARLTRDHRAVTIHDASSLSPGSEVELSSREPIFVSFGEDMIRMDLRK